jgi:hypothetical protein
MCVSDLIFESFTNIGIKLAKMAKIDSKINKKNFQFVDLNIYFKTFELTTTKEFAFATQLENKISDFGQTGRTLMFVLNF